MALSRKYSALPDLDTAPDVYETPELTDDNSTVLTTARGSLTDDESDPDDANAGISRSHVQVDQARSRFLGKDVDARDVDFSDRVDGKRKSYRTTSRRRMKNGGVELGDLSDEEDGDGDEDEENDLERKIARLKREVEEAKDAYGRQRATQAATPQAAPAVAGSDLDLLSQALDDISKLTDADADVARHLHSVPPTSAAVSAPEELGSPTQREQPSTAVVYSRGTTATPSLAQVAEFDRRLALLERSIGIGSSVLPGLEGAGGSSASSTALPRAILPTLDTLQRQVATLADTSTASLDGISRRVRTLTQEAEQLTKARKTAKEAHDELVQAGVSGGDKNAAGGATTAADADSDQTAKINALYGTLPTIENLTPLLPPLLDRLRSLQAIHADAAMASELLDSLEQRQADTAAEVKQWREGLDKIEAAMREGQTTMGKNMQVMEGWVKGLEERLDKA